MSPTKLFLMLPLIVMIFGCNDDPIITEPEANTIILTVKEGGKPLPGITVTAHDQDDYDIIKNGVTNKNGKVVLGPLIEDEYYFIFTGKGSIPFSVSREFQIIQGLSVSEEVNIDEQKVNISIVEGELNDFNAKLFNFLRGRAYTLSLYLSSSIDELVDFQDLTVQEGNIELPIEIDGIYEGYYGIYFEGSNVPILQFSVDDFTDETIKGRADLFSFLSLVNMTHLQTLNRSTSQISTVKPIESFEFQYDNPYGELSASIVYSGGRIEKLNMGGYSHGSDDLFVRLGLDIPDHEEYTFYDGRPFFSGDSLKIDFQNNSGEFFTSYFGMGWK